MDKRDYVYEDALRTAEATPTADLSAYTDRIRRETVELLLTRREWWHFPNGRQGTFSRNDFYRAAGLAPKEG